MLQTNERKERILNEAWYIVDNNATVRKTAEVFSISKTQVHKDLTQELQKLNYPLYLEVRNILNFNIFARAYRGGMALRRKCKKWFQKEQVYIMLALFYYLFLLLRFLK